MIKYLSIFILAVSFIGCQSDSPPEQVPAQGQQPMDGQMQDPMQQQPSVDTDVSDEELEIFVESAVKAQEVQMEAQQEMMAVVQEEGIDVQTYNQIAEAQQMGQSTDELDVSQEDLDRYESASASIEEIEQKTDTQMSETIEESGLDMNRFQEINMAIQQDPSLQQRVQALMQDSQMQQAPPAQGPQQQQPPQPDGY